MIEVISSGLSFVAYLAGAWFGPRITLAVVFLIQGGLWGNLLGGMILFMVADGEKRFKDHLERSLTFTVNFVAALFTGRVVIVTRIVEKKVRVEVPKEKIVEKIVIKKVREKMTEEEALAVFGLSKGAKGGDVEERYRKIIKLVHPDVGGSNYLAKVVNEAKELLVG